MSQLSVSKLLGKKYSYVSLAIMNSQEIRIGDNVLKACDSLTSLEIALSGDGSVALTIDHTRVIRFTSKAKATNWLKREFKHITDYSRLIVHVSDTYRKLEYAKRFDSQWAVQEIAEGAIAPRKNTVMRVHFTDYAYYEVSESKRVNGMFDVLYVSTRFSIVKWLYRYTYEGVTDWLSTHSYLGENFDLVGATERGDVYRP